MFKGTLFAQDFLTDSIRDMPDWEDVSSELFDAFRSSLEIQFKKFPTDGTPNEATTESELIWPILEALGWNDSLPQQNLSNKGREEVPDGILFLSSKEKEKALEKTGEFRRYAFATCLVEAKRWDRPLDRRTKGVEDKGTPSSQILNYLSSADRITDRKLKWGILTNGALWRLYWQDAKSRRDDFFEVDLRSALEDKTDHQLKVFYLLFGRTGFALHPSKMRTLHARALDIARYYEERVAEDLSGKIFNEVYPALAKAISAAAPDSPMEDVRNAALVLLYRLLFVLYAEDRDLLPVHEKRYDDYGLRERVRNDIGRRLAEDDTFSDTRTSYWDHFAGLCRGIDKGDKSIGIPPYNGGLFNSEKHELLETIRLSDTVMVTLVDAMCFAKTEAGDRKYINYRDLSVQQLGSVYERLLEYEITETDGIIDIRPNIFARKGSGSYYTPENLVDLIIEETLRPLIDRAYETADPADEILKLKICDPAMGSGHFLVSLVDFLSDEVATAIERTSEPSAVIQRVELTREKIFENAREKQWAVKEEHLDDPHIIRRMVLKRCIYGVDKNAMAVELAKVSLWLHTFTVGAPLSFLDHHLKCGDSLFGMSVYDWRNDVELLGGSLLSQPLVREAASAENIMKTIEMLADAEIEEVEQSKSMYGEMMEKVSDLYHFMSFAHALRWMKLNSKDKGIISAFYTEHFGDPKWIMAGTRPPRKNVRDSERFAEIWAEARELMEEENFLHWQVAFPGVWDRWSSPSFHGGFDAVIGNPPWDRIKLQQVEWFAARRPEIAMKPRASDRKKAIAELEKNDDPLFEDFKKADKRAQMQLSEARRDKKKGGHYPLLGRGDINLYSLFVERAQSLLKTGGMMGLLVPSGIASDKTAAKFFSGVATTGKLKALYDFENRRTRCGLDPFFPDVDSRFKFSAIIISGHSLDKPASCAFFLQSPEEILDPDRCFPLSPEDFARINPNTGTAPIFRTRRDAEITRTVYKNLPVLIDHSGREPIKTWPVKYSTMFHMTNDSDKFRTRQELERNEGAYPIGGNVWDSPSGEWVPLYVGRMIHLYDHRSASVKLNEANLHNAALSGDVTLEEKQNPNFVPTPQYWVNRSEVNEKYDAKYFLAFRDIARATDVRTFVTSLTPFAAFNNKLPILSFQGTSDNSKNYLLANMASISFDFVARTKAHSTSMNWYIVEQLPVVPPETYEAVKFGSRTAGEIVRETVLELTYTAHDMAPFAKDMGYVDAAGEVKPPFIWDEDRRLHLKAKLDALYFILYGITDPGDVDYIYSTFPIVERQEKKLYGEYRTAKLAKHWINALQAGRPDAEIKL